MQEAGEHAHREERLREGRGCPLEDGDAVLEGVESQAGECVVVRDHRVRAGGLLVVVDAREGVVVLRLSHAQVVVDGVALRVCELCCLQQLVEGAFGANQLLLLDLQYAHSDLQGSLYLHSVERVHALLVLLQMLVNDRLVIRIAFHLHLLLWWYHSFLKWVRCPHMLHQRLLARELLPAQLTRQII